MPQALTHAQCVALLGAVRSPVYRGTLGVMYGCGLRIGEAVKVTVTDIDATGLVIRVVGKENKERLAPLPRGLLDAASCVGHTSGSGVAVRQQAGLASCG